KLTKSRLPDHVPLLHTVFSPLTIAMKLSDSRAIADIRNVPGNVRAALEIITETTRQHAMAALEAGADGVFFASPCADERVATVDEYLQFGLPFDLIVLGPLASKCTVLFHMHGERPMLDLSRQYPAQFVNWHDRRTGPSLPDGQRSSDRSVA